MKGPFSGDEVCVFRKEKAKLGPLFEQSFTYLLLCRGHRGRMNQWLECFKNYKKHVFFYYYNCISCMWQKVNLFTINLVVWLVSTDFPSVQPLLRVHYREETFFWCSSLTTETPASIYKGPRCTPYLKGKPLYLLIINIPALPSYANIQICGDCDAFTSRLIPSFNSCLSELDNSTSHCKSFKIWNQSLGGSH